MQDEALAVARSIQKPGQTKEQTRLIAQGIAKGMEQYKRQQSAKARERDKARKRQEKARQISQAAEGDHTSGDNSEQVYPTRVLLLAGNIMLMMAALLGLPLYTGWSIRVGPWTMPLWACVASVVAMIALALWTLRSASTNRR